jgi:2-methylcitrate dehydratase PrpD
VADTPLAARLAARLLERRADLRRADAVEAARVGVVDTIAVTLLGSVAPCTRLVAGLPGIAAAPGPALVLGTDRRTTVLDAALLNGVASHADDYDDFTQVFGGHPSVPLLPALIALGEARGSTGAALLEAYAAGVELETRLAAGVHFHHYEKGWHPTSTLGTLGAAGACGALIGLGEERLATALGVAVSLASGVKANFGTMTKPLHVGHCTRNGLMAALLAEQGFSAAPDALEHPHGFLEAFNGAGNYDVGRMLDGWYEPPAIVDPGLGVKQFPCCGSTHPAIFVALRVRTEHQLDPREIEAVEVLTHPLRLPHTDNPAPANALECKFSMQYCVARALADGHVRLADFEGQPHREARVQALMRRLAVAADPQMARQSERAFGARIRVRTRDGRTLVDAVEQLVGRGPQLPMTQAELWEKFSDCATRVLPAGQVEAAWHSLSRLPDLCHLGELTASLQPCAVAAGSARESAAPGSPSTVAGSARVAP